MSFSSWVNRWIFQFAHVGWAAFLTLLLQRHFWWGWLAVLAFAAIKEFIFDPLTEDPALSGGRKGDALDFLFFNVGIWIGLVVNLWR
jgi:hypothetical protein